MWNPLKHFGELHKAYQLTFGSVAGNIVEKDIAKFCRANRSCYHPDERIAWMLEGRREVWLRIQRYRGLSAEELIALLADELEQKQATRNQGEDDG